MKLEFDDFTIEFNQTDELKEAVFERVMQYFKEHESFSGESIVQSDDPTIDAPYVMADIADRICKFKFEWND